MMEFNKEVVDKIYSLLELICNRDVKQECDIAFRGCSIGLSLGMHRSLIGELRMQ